MTNRELKNLLRIGQLKPEPHATAGQDGLLRSCGRRLSGTERINLSIESHFYLADNATHSLALTALRAKGYPTQSHYLTIQCLQHTIDLPNAQSRMLGQAHCKCYFAEYEGEIDVDERLVNAMLRVAQECNQIANVQVGYLLDGLILTGVVTS